MQMQPRSRTEAEAEPASLSKDETRSIAKCFGDIWRRAALVAIHAGGMLLLERVYGGSEEAFHRSGPKGTALPQVAIALQEVGVQITAAKLRRYVRQALVLERFRVQHDLGDLNHIKPSHLDELCGLPDTAQVQLIEAAEREKLSVVRLRAVRDAFAEAASFDRPELELPHLANSASRPPPTRAKGRPVQTDEPVTQTPEAPDCVTAQDLEDWLEAAVRSLEARATIDRAERVEAKALSVLLRSFAERVEAALHRQGRG